MRFEQAYGGIPTSPAVCSTDAAMHPQYDEARVIFKWIISKRDSIIDLHVVGKNEEQNPSPLSDKETREWIIGSLLGQSFLLPDILEVTAKLTAARNGLAWYIIIGGEHLVCTDLSLSTTFQGAWIRTVGLYGLYTWWARYLHSSKVSQRWFSYDTLKMMTFVWIFLDIFSYQHLDRRNDRSQTMEFGGRHNATKRHFHI